MAPFDPSMSKDSVITRTGTEHGDLPVQRILVSNVLHIGFELNDIVQYQFEKKRLEVCKTRN